VLRNYNATYRFWDPPESSQVAEGETQPKSESEEINNVEDARRRSDLLFILKELDSVLNPVSS
jgi:hypothetical protein